MAAPVSCVGTLARLNSINCVALTSIRHSRTLPGGLLDKHRKSKIAHDREADVKRTTPLSSPDYRYVYPDFLPDPDWKKRDRIAEILARKDMLKRREVLEIPEFYVGTIMAVTVSDPYASGKKNRFVGICIHRGGYGLRSTFTLRNHIDGQGIEVAYDLYNPTLQKIEILKLEKRLDEELYYLRDCAPEYSTIPFDIAPVIHPPGAAVPVNTIKVKMGPRPWHERWERQDLKGVQDLDLPDKFYIRAAEVAKPWEKRDIMKEYRERINDDEASEILSEVRQGIDVANKKRKEYARRRKVLSKA